MYHKTFQGFLLFRKYKRTWSFPREVERLIMDETGDGSVLHLYGGRHLIRVEESLDKEKALNYDNETLAPLGMKKVHTDEFCYELKKEEVK